MDEYKEYREARDALIDVREEINHILDRLSSAKRWSIADIFLDSAILSLGKRDKIKKINSDLEVLRDKLALAKKELRDVNINFNKEISDTGLDMFFDVFFDNIFTDLRVNSELNSMMDSLYDLRDKVDELLKKL